MKIKICEKNIAKISAALAAANGKSTAHTYANYADIEKLVERATEYENGFLRYIPKKNRAGIKIDFISGDGVARTYKYSRTATAVTLLRGAVGWFLTGVQQTTIYEAGGDETVQLTQYQSDCLHATLSSRYTVYPAAAKLDDTVNRTDVPLEEAGGYSPAKLLGGKENEMRKITEEMGIHKEWYIAAETMTVKKLPEFIVHLTTDFEHAYGTMCHAIAAAAIASAKAVDNSEQGKITGVQALHVMQNFITEWMGYGEAPWMGYGEAPSKLVNYQTMLYPTAKAEYTSISRATWIWLIKAAKEKIEEYKDNTYVAEEVRTHWQSIADGTVPFGYSVEE